MYIEYEATQWYNNFKREKLIKTVPHALPKPDFMPTKLVRISDMEVVDGSQIKEGYCAFSYSWNQSGKILIHKITGETKRIDQGGHTILRSDNSRTYVKFEGVIQQICQQFNIKYIWYDQMCIDQDNKENKQREIRNTHCIYTNAYCTVAFIPEYYYKESHLLSKHQYFKRLWTFIELVNSKELLLVGKNTHQWSKDILQHDSIYPLIRPLFKERSVSRILYHAHQLKSAQDHDRIFALIQLFPDIIDQINIDYDQPIQDLIIRFYALLAKKDISILAFNKSKADKEYNSAIQKYRFLPSWTGVNGVHDIDMDTKIPSSSFQDYLVNGKTMYITSTFATRNDDQPIQEEFQIVQREDLLPLPEDIADFDDLHNYCLCIHAQLPGMREKKRIKLSAWETDYNDSIFVKERDFDRISNELQQLSRFMEIKKENLCWWPRTRNEEEWKEETYVYSVNFDCLTEDVNDSSAHYVILSEIIFKSNIHHTYFYYPVIRKKQNEEYYEAIGCCQITTDGDDFFSSTNCNLPKKIFLIQ